MRPPARPLRGGDRPPPWPARARVVQRRRRTPSPHTLRELQQRWQEHTRALPLACQGRAERHLPVGLAGGRRRQRGPRDVRGPVAIPSNSVPLVVCHINNTFQRADHRFQPADLRDFEHTSMLKCRLHRRYALPNFFSERHIAFPAHFTNIKL